MKRVQLRCVLRTDLLIGDPRATTPRGRVNFGMGEAPDDASVMGLQGVLDWLMNAFDVSRKEALALASVVVDVEVTQLVNGVRGVHAVLGTEAREGRTKGA